MQDQILYCILILEDKDTLLKTVFCTSLPRVMAFLLFDCLTNVPLKW